MGRAVVSIDGWGRGAAADPLAGIFSRRTIASEKFAAAVVQLLSKPQLRAELGEAADRFVRGRYTSDTVARQFEDISACRCWRRIRLNPPLKCTRT